VDAGGNVFLSGHVGDFPPFKFFAMKYGPNGDSLWARDSDAPGMGDKAAHALGLDGSGNAYVTGMAADAGGTTGQDFITIKYAEKTSMVIQAFSPVDLTVTDPNGDSIGVSFNTIAGASYSVSNDSIQIGQVTAGNYQIKVKLDSLDISGDTTYTLAIQLAGGSSQNLASDFHVPGAGITHAINITVNPATPDCFAIAGDASSNGGFSIGDLLPVVNYYFNKAGWPACGSNSPLCWLSGMLCRGDWNGNGAISIGDIVHGVNYIFNKPGDWTPIAPGVCCLPAP
jgi:hypothetical protein